MKPRRLARLERQIKTKVAQVLLRDMQDPRLGLITITRVDLDPELVLCKVYWSVMGEDKERRLNEQALLHSSRFIQRAVAESLSTRTVPRLEFRYDESIAGAIRVQAILEELEKERRRKEDARGSSEQERPQG